jgi:hypothetical protein
MGTPTDELRALTPEALRDMIHEESNFVIKRYARAIKDNPGTTDCELKDLHTESYERLMRVYVERKEDMVRDYMKNKP